MKSVVIEKSRENVRKKNISSFSIRSLTFINFITKAESFKVSEVVTDESNNIYLATLS